MQLLFGPGLTLSCVVMWICTFEIKHKTQKSFKKKTQGWEINYKNIYIHIIYAYMMHIYTHNAIHIYCIYIHLHIRHWWSSSLLTMVTDAHFRSVEENWWKGENFPLFPSVFHNSFFKFNFWLGNSTQKLLCLLLCKCWVKNKNVTWKGRKSWYFLTGAVGDWGWVRRFWLTQCTPLRSSPADELGNVGRDHEEKIGRQWFSTTGRRFV